MMSYHR